ncbi:MAG TPA: sugar phosphate nucleotidyltransferase [Candidatus Paceibacterota bacterium]|nr:sugar phosphate nucleotidyltransferase [Candidatus Paceibacterota bacterium]
MQAVILAGGKGTRMGDLSKEIPKPMLSLSGKNLLQHKIDRLPKEIDEVVLIVHHKKEVIRDFFSSEYNGRKITYVDQGEPHGTAHALWKAEPVLGEEFISLMGDDVYSEESIKKS